MAEECRRASPNEAAKSGVESAVDFCGKGKVREGSVRPNRS